MGVERNSEQMDSTVCLDGGKDQTRSRRGEEAEKSAQCIFDTVGDRSVLIGDIVVDRIDNGVCVCVFSQSDLTYI